MKRGGGQPTSKLGCVFTQEFDDLLWVQQELQETFTATCVAQTIEFC